MKVAVLAELHARGGDPVRGMWARRQALAAQAGGAEVRVFAPHRPHALSVRALRRRVDFDLIHAHGIPAADAVRRARLDVPTLVSVYGPDVFDDLHGLHDGTGAIARTLGAARLTLAGSEGSAELARAHGARETRVVHLGAELPERGRGQMYPAPLRSEAPTLVTVGDLAPRKRHADVVRALAVLVPRHPDLRYLIVGEGPERTPLEGLASRLGVADRVEMAGRLAPQEALERARACTIFVMPSTEEAFGVADLEAMAAGMPAIGCRGEPGPEEIAAAGDGFLLVPPGDVERLSQRIEELLCDPQRLRYCGQHARETIAAHFTWERCGQQTLAAYEDALH
jgi:teichuronic acid biosynthesis glycosyltransferase TuaC